MKPLSRKFVDNKKSAHVFSKKAERTKSINLTTGGIRGGIRL